MSGVWLSYNVRFDEFGVDTSGDVSFGWGLVDERMRNVNVRGNHGAKIDRVDGVQ